MLISLLILSCSYRLQAQNLGQNIQKLLQRIWDKTRCYYGKFGEHVGKPVNVMRTHLEFMETTKILKTQHCPQSPKENKNGPLVHDGSPHWLPRIFIPIFFLYHFGPRLMAGTPIVRIKSNVHEHAISLGQNGKEQWQAKKLLMANMHPRGPCYILLGRVGVLDLCCFLCVPTLLVLSYNLQRHCGNSFYGRGGIE